MRYQTDERRFHSINFPSEWGVIVSFPPLGIVVGFHSINFPSEWGVQGGVELVISDKVGVGRFHSINFPSEWGVTACPSMKGKVYRGVVSIQLISPASGEE